MQLATATYLTNLYLIVANRVLHRVSEAVMSQQNVFASNFLLKMKIQLKLFSTIPRHKHMTY